MTTYFVYLPNIGILAIEKITLMIKAILFDMDGVIIDSEPIHKTAYFKTFTKIGLDISEDEYYNHTGKSTISAFRSICEIYQPKETPEELVEMKRAFFYDIFDNDPTVHLIDGVLPLIKNYYKNGLKLVLASSAHPKTIKAVFDRFNLDPYFVGKISGATLKASKPHPEIFEKAAEIAGFAKEECMVIEDSTNGIKAAHSAGIFCTAYKSPHSKNQDYSLASHIISDYTEIYYERMVEFLGTN